MKKLILLILLFLSFLSYSQTTLFNPQTTGQSGRNLQTWKGFHVPDTLIIDSCFYLNKYRGLGIGVLGIDNNGKVFWSAVGGGSPAVDSIWRVAGIDSFYWKKSGIPHSILDSIGGGLSSLRLNEVGYGTGISITSDSNFTRDPSIESFNIVSPSLGQSILHINGSDNTYSIGDTLFGNQFSMNTSGFTFKSSGGNFMTINGITYIFPTSPGDSGTFLKNDGAQNLSWDSIPSLGIDSSIYKFNGTIYDPYRGVSGIGTNQIDFLNFNTFSVGSFGTVNNIQLDATQNWEASSLGPSSLSAASYLDIHAGDSLFTQTGINRLNRTTEVMMTRDTVTGRWGSRSIPSSGTTIDTLKNGYGITGGNFNGSTNITHAVDSATLSQKYFQKNDTLNSLASRNFVNNKTISGHILNTNLSSLKFYSGLISPANYDGSANDSARVDTAFVATKRYADSVATSHSSQWVNGTGQIYYPGHVGIGDSLQTPDFLFQVRDGAGNSKIKIDSAGGVSEMIGVLAKLSDDADYIGVSGGVITMYIDAGNSPKMFIGQTSTGTAGDHVSILLDPSAVLDSDDVVRKKDVTSIIGFYEYSVTLTQTGSGDPAIVAAINDTTDFSNLVGGITFKRSGAGDYTVSRGDAVSWDRTTTSVIIGSANGGSDAFSSAQASTYLDDGGFSKFYINTTTLGVSLGLLSVTGTDGKLTNTPLTIKIKK